MALNVAQYEEIASLLRQVPRLVDRLEARRSGFAEDVLEWLKQVNDIVWWPKGGGWKNQSPTAC
jgi:hypothetical protein